MLFCSILVPYFFHSFTSPPASTFLSSIFLSFFLSFGFALFCNFLFNHPILFLFLFFLSSFLFCLPFCTYVAFYIFLSFSMNLHLIVAFFFKNGPDMGWEVCWIWVWNINGFQTWKCVETLLQFFGESSPSSLKDGLYRLMQSWIVPHTCYH